MAGQLLLINPRKRRGTKRRTAAQKAATARMVAANRARRSTRMSNPKRRTKRRVTHHASPVQRVQSRVRHHKRRRNPSLRHGSAGSLGFTGHKLMEAAKNAGIAAGGALVVDYAYGFIKGYLPASVQTPVDSTGAINPLYYLAKGLAAVGLGVLGAKAVGARTASKMAEGSLVVTAYAALRNLMPATIASGMGYYQPAATDTPNLPGNVNMPINRGQGSVTDLRAYLSAQSGRSARAKTAYDNPGMGAYLAR